MQRFSMTKLVILLIDGTNCISHVIQQDLCSSRENNWKIVRTGRLDTESVIKEIKSIKLAWVDIGSFIFIKMLEKGACKVE